MLYIVLNASRVARVDCPSAVSANSIQLKDALANTIKILKIYSAVLFISIAMMLSSYSYFKFYAR